MKLAFSLALLISSVSGFAPSPFGVQSNTALFSTRPDTSNAIQAALEASQKYGATSPEARVAWDVVEEMDASDNSAATAGSFDNNCLLEEESSKACADYGNKLDELAHLVKEQGPHVEKMKSLVNELGAVKLSAPKPKAGADSPELRAALDNARKLSQEKGATSPEAKVAWAEVEEIASSGTSNAIGKRLDQECLVETAMEACTALEELNRALQLKENGDRYSG